VKQEQGKTGSLTCHACTCLDVASAPPLSRVHCNVCAAAVCSNLWLSHHTIFSMAMAISQVSQEQQEGLLLVVNCREKRGGTIHVALRSSMRGPLHLYRTRCGWRFGKAGAVARTRFVVGIGHRCRKCLPAHAWTACERKPDVLPTAEKSSSQTE
jgi:hypothetical protein